MNHYSSRHSQASALAKQVAIQLEQAIDTRGQAMLVVAGGNTPKLFFNELSQIKLNWSNVTILPSDERWVSHMHPRSNYKLIDENLRVTKARSATLVSLYIDNMSPEQALPKLQSRLMQLNLPIDVLVLGMGNDGHIASLFPNASNLKKAMSQAGSESVVVINAPGAAEPRISLTLSMLLTARHSHLLICGFDKLTTLNQAYQEGDDEMMPVRAIIGNPLLQIHYAL